jgi:prepilin-type N-terminal cleavage/methylation domain-containing protein
MKNVKLNLKKAAKAGFSLVEMLVVIAIIGIIAAIAIPNIGSINAAANEAAIQRNAQNAASVWNSAVAAGALTSATPPDTSTVASILSALETGVAGTGPFATNTFATGTLEDKLSIEDKLELAGDKTLIYNKDG